MILGFEFTHNHNSHVEQFTFCMDMGGSKNIDIELPKFSISSLLGFFIAIKVGDSEPLDWFGTLAICFCNKTGD
jgi:hypothetical protein